MEDCFLGLPGVGVEIAIERKHSDLHYMDDLVRFFETTGHTRLAQHRPKKTVLYLPAVK